MKNKSYKYFLLLFTIVYILIPNQVKAVTERSCTVSVDVSNYATDEKNSKYFYGNILKNCPGSKDSSSYSNPKATVTSNTSGVNMNFSYARTNGVFKFNNLTSLKNNTSMTVKLTYKDANGTDQVTNLRFMFVVKANTTTTNVCCYNKARGTYYTSTSCYGKDLEPQADRSKCNAQQDGSSSEEQVSACYRVSKDNKTWLYKYDKENNLLKNYVYVNKMEKDKDGNPYTQKTCASENNTLKDTTDQNSSSSSNTSGAGTSSSTGGNTSISDTSSASTGENVCKNYRIERVRSYNCTGDKACKKLKAANLNYKNEGYFYSAVSNMDNYYYVYKTYYDCEGFDKTEAMTSFCIDPGLEGPRISAENGNKYEGTSIGVTTDFGKGLYRLYTYWYLEKGNEIRSMYQGASPTGSEDFLDYVMDNVARKLRLVYDRETSDYIASLQKEWKAYADHDLGTGTSLASNKLKEIWQDVSNFVKNGSVTTTSDVDKWIMPVKKYEKLVGDFKDGTTGYYCNVQAGDGTYSESAWNENKNNNKNTHSGIDFTINSEDIGKVPVYAAQSGVIKFRWDNNKTAGNAIGIVVTLSDGTELLTRYLHLASFASGIKTGATVQKGQIIGYVGNTGKSSGPHLHFDISINNSNNGSKAPHISPRKYLPMDNIGICSQEQFEQSEPTVSESTENSTLTSVKFDIDETVSSQKKNGNKGFETEFKVTISSENINVINEIINSKKYKILVKTSEGEEINSENLQVTTVNDWSIDPVNVVATATYKVSCDNIYNYVSGDSLEYIRVGMQISYTEPKSADNVVILSSTETNNDRKTTKGSPKNLQDFVVFLNGTLNKYAGITITFDKDKENVCKPTFALPCTGPETVVYLIEGTQSGALFNTVMNGIKSVDDLRNVISSANEMVQNLINGNFTNLLDKDNLQVISGLLYNFVDKASIVRNIKNELSFLNTLGNNGNKTAAALYKEINASSFSTNSAENFKTLSRIISRTLVNVALNGYDKVSSEWQEIVEAAQANAESKLTSNSLVELLENIGNAITSSKENLKNVFSAVENLTDYLSKFTNITDIESAVTSFSATIKSVITDGLSKLSGIKDGLTSMLNQLGSGVTSLSQVSNIFDSITNALIVDWDKCIIGENGVEATDPGGNSYTIQESNDDGSNIFCTIVCKEDYAVKSPGSLGTVYAGRYISTNLDNVYHATLGMAGQRTCATTEIKNDKYVETATAKKDEMLATYNEFYESYAKYKALKTYEKTANQKESGTSHPAYTTFDKLNTDKIFDKLQLELESVIKNSFNTFFVSIFGNEAAEEVMTNFAQDALEMAAKMGALALSGDLNADNVKSLATSYVKQKVDQTIQNLEGAVQNLLSSLTNNCISAAEDVLKTAGVNLLSGGGQLIIEAACNYGPGLLDTLFGIGEVLRAACAAYSGFSMALSTGITSVNASTGYKIFQIEDGIPYTYSYYPYVYENSETLQKKLAANFVEAENVAKNLITKNASSSGNRAQLWVMKYEGTFKMGSLNYGSIIFRTAKQIYYLTQDIQRFGNLDILDSGALENQLNSFINSIQGLSGGFKLSWLKKNYDSLSTDGFDGLSGMISNVMSIFSDISGATDNVLTGITDLVDSALLVYYDFLGIFNPFYSSLAEIRREMEGYKEEYNALQEDLTDLADRMNACTEWTNTYQFNPQIEFTYGYSNNNLLDYITNKKSITTDKITLKAINKNEEPEQITYYCQQGVDIKDVQNWDVITSGKCTTDDGIFGSVLSSLLGDDNAMSSILNVFRENSAGLKKILNSSKVKEYISSTGYADKISNFLCSGLGEAFCGIFGDENEDGSLVTLVPGSIVYKLKTSTNSSSSNGIQSWTGLLSAIGGGGSLDSILSGITRNLTYSTGIPNDVKYHDVGRVVSISRYGNPGVSVSGLSWTSILSNIASYVTDKTGINALDKINDTLMSVTGQGAQQFIYYKSSKPYWTYSNKGIYIINPDVVDPVDAPVLVDNGDPALTDDSIKSGTDAEKQPEGLVYPIALSTAEGKYHYQIKINNVGQYYDNVNNLGRIIDDTGYVSGLYANKYVCDYEVKKEPEHEETCETIIASSDCTSQEEPKTLYFKQYKANYNDKTLENQVNTCVTKLLSEGDTCCSYVENYEDSLPDSSKELYRKMCKCNGTKVIGTINDTTDGSSSSSSSALITKTGTLQFYTKVVSNYDLFPNANSSKGYNWSGQTSGYENATDTNKTPSKENLSDIIDEIEKIGDGIYDEDNADKYLEYSITLNGACMSKIKEYNDQKEVLGLGFGDYTAGSISQETRDYTSKFLQEIEENNEYSSCKISNYLNRNK